MLAGGIDLRTTSGRLGHSGRRHHLRVYAHAVPEAHQRTTGVLGALVLRTHGWERSERLRVTRV